MGVALGVALTLLAGVLSGVYALPMTRVRKWKWEHLWFSYCTIAGWVFPTVYAVAATPRLGYVLSTRSAIYVALCGLAWGVSSLLFGLGLDLVGQALTFGIVLSVGSTVGSLFPLLILSPEEAFSVVGIFDWAGLAVAVVGVCFLSWSGLTKARELAATAVPHVLLVEESKEDNTEPKSEAEEATPPTEMETTDSMPSTDSKQSSAVEEEEQQSTSGSKHMKLGIVLCVIAGLLSLLNLGFALASDMKQKALENGASIYTASAAVWFVALVTGNIINLTYPGYLMIKQHTWKTFLCDGSMRDLAINIGIITTMSVLWFGGMVIYGYGATEIGGTLGAALGWPIFMCSQMLSANVCSIIAGEWRGTQRKSRLIMAAGVFTLLVSISILGVGSSFNTPDSSSSSSSSSS